MLNKIIALAIAAGFASASFAQATPAVPATPTAWRRPGWAGSRTPPPRSPRPWATGADPAAPGASARLPEAEKATPGTLRSGRLPL